MKLLLKTLIKTRGNVQAIIMPYKHPIATLMSNLGCTVKDLMQLKSGILGNISMIVRIAQDFQLDALLDELETGYPTMNTILLFEDGSVVNTTPCCSYMVDADKFKVISGKDLAKMTSSRFVNFLNEDYDEFLIIGGGDIYSSLIYHSEDGLDVDNIHSMV